MLIAKAWVRRRGIIKNGFHEGARTLGKNTSGLFTSLIASLIALKLCSALNRYEQSRVCRLSNQRKASWEPGTCTKGKRLCCAL